MHPRDVAARMAPSARSLPLSLSRSMEKGRPRFPRRFESCRFHVWRPFFHQDSPPTIRGLRDPAARSERDGDKCNGGGGQGGDEVQDGESRAIRAHTHTHAHTGYSSLPSKSASHRGNTPTATPSPAAAPFPPPTGLPPEPLTHPPTRRGSKGVASAGGEWRSE